jgi:hypothetical protein
MLYFFDKSYRVYKYSKQITEEQDSIAQIPNNATTIKPKFENSPYLQNGKLKDINWREKNKIAMWVWDDYTSVKGHWRETYFLPEPYYKVDKREYFTGVLGEGGCFDEPPNMPFEKPSAELKIAKWNKDKGIWEEGNKKVVLLDDNGFVVNKNIDLSDIIYSKANYVDIR